MNQGPSEPCYATGKINILHCRATKTESLAVKAVFKEHIPDGIRLSKLTGELAILRRLKHDNTVELIDEFDNDALHCVVLPLFVVSAPPLYRGAWVLPPMDA